MSWYFVPLIVQLRTSSGTGPTRSCIEAESDSDERPCSEICPNEKHGSPITSSKILVRLIAASPNSSSPSVVAGGVRGRKFWIVVPVLIAPCTSVELTTKSSKWPVFEQPSPFV